MEKKIKFIDGEMIEYEILKLVSQYDPILKTPTTEIDFEKMEGREIAYLSMSLMQSLEKYNGIGLSANQVGLNHRMFAINLFQDDKIWCLINPKILSVDTEATTTYNEGCLTFPGLYLKLDRPSWVELEFCAANGTKLVQKFEGIMATCVLHEMDHLDGKLFTELVHPIHLNKAKRKIKSNLKRMKRVNAITV